MKPSIRSLALTAILCFLPTLATAQNSNRAAVEQTMQQLMRGFEAGDSALIFEAFRKDGIVVGHSATTGKLVTLTAEAWAEGFPGKPAADEDQRHRSYEILDVTDEVAMVKVRLDYPGWDGVDYLALLKIDGRWQIVSKSWGGKRKPAAT